MTRHTAAIDQGYFAEHNHMSDGYRMPHRGFGGSLSSVNIRFLDRFLKRKHGNKKEGTYVK